MALLLNCQSIGKSFGSRPLFANVTMTIDSGERLGLIGPNGSGKSTLLKILAGLETTDTGEVGARRNLHAGYVAQQDVFAEGATPLSAVAEALGPIDHDHHERETHAAVVLAKVGFDDVEQPVDTLSGGWRKRLSIARQLAREPDLLLLDEPTNHLDLEGIEWLESLLDDAPFGAVIVTHDRYFLEEATTRIVELSRAYPDGTLDINGPYSEFLRRREEFMAAQAHQQQALSSKVRQDIAWLSRGAKARRTKAKGRIDDSAQRMQQLAELKQRNAPQRAAGIDFNATGRQTRKLLTATGISKSLGDRTLFRNLDIMLSPGTRLGLIGANGSGKTTLIRVLTGELTPDTGEIKQADNLRVVTFTQQREQLDRTVSLREALCPISDVIYYHDRAIHVATWAQKFLFRAEQLNVPVSSLSGGEQARILIAALMREPADVLVLDEPTNDLDIPTLEVLEQSLDEFPGAVVLVTHDRFMLDRLSTEVLALDGEGGARPFASYSQWVDVKERELAANQEPKKSKPAAAPAPERDKPKVKKLTYDEQRELGKMESRIESAESKVQTLQQKMNDPDTLADHARLTELCHQMDAAQAEVAALYARWEELEARR